MTTKKIFAFLSVLFLTLPAIADHKPSHQPDPPFLVPGGILWALFDSDTTPKLVGKVDHVDNSLVWVQLEVDGTTGIFALTPFSFQANTTLFFTSNDCTGQAYAGALGGFNTAHVAGTLADFNARITYEAVGASVNQSINSIVFANDTACFALSFGPIDLIPIDPTGTDLHADYPPPYVLIEQ